jgi:hypothetical protein
MMSKMINNGNVTLSKSGKALVVKLNDGATRQLESYKTQKGEERVNVMISKADVIGLLNNINVNFTEDYSVIEGISTFGFMDVDTTVETSDEEDYNVVEDFQKEIGNDDRETGLRDGSGSNPE